MRSLYELEVRVEDDVDDTDHIEILVQPAVNVDNVQEFGSPAAAELIAAGVHHAGLLGRLAATLTPWVDGDRKLHRCGRGGPGPSRYGRPPSWFEACSLTGYGLISPADEEAHQPYLVFYIPGHHCEAWLRRIRDALSTIAGGDA